MRRHTSQSIRKQSSRKRRKKRGFFDSLLIRIHRFRRNRRNKKRQKKLRPSDLRKRKIVRTRRRVIVLSILGVVVLALIIVGLWFLVRIDYFAVERIDVRNTRTLPAENIELFLSREIQKGESRFFPYTNSLFVPRHKMEQLLLRNFLKINDVSIEKKGFNEIVVIIDEREPHVIFCEDVSRSDVFAGGCFYGDESGVIFERIEENISNATPFITVHFETSDTEDVLGKVLLEDSSLQALYSLRSILDQEDISLTKIDLKDEGFEIETDARYTLVLNTQDSYRSEMSRLFSVIELDEFGEGVSLNDIYEFDLRFGSKVFYRYSLDQERGVEQSDIDVEIEEIEEDSEVEEEIEESFDEDSVEEEE